MRIENPVSHEISSSKSREVRRLDPRPVEGPSKDAEVRRDEATISEEARLLQRIRQSIDEQPAIREDLVAKLRQRIEDGTYQVGEDAHVLERILQAIDDVPDVSQDQTVALQRDGQGSSFQISDDARLLQRVRQAVEEGSAVREDLIKRIKQQIENGTYRINDEALIDALLNPDQGGIKLQG